VALTGIKPSSPMRAMSSAGHLDSTYRGQRVKIKRRAHADLKVEFQTRQNSARTPFLPNRACSKPTT